MLYLKSETYSHLNWDLNSQLSAKKMVDSFLELNSNFPLGDRLV